MDHTPVCPKCGCRTFRFNVLQRVEVVFNDDTHEVIEQPHGDIEWDETVATCTNCDHRALLCEMEAPNLTRPDHQLTADELRQKYHEPNSRDGREGGHPKHTWNDWYQTVACGSTILGYWEWVVEKVEQDYEKECRL